MAITIGSTEFPRLTAQPFGFNASDSSAGLSARKWSITGLLTPAEWLGLVGEYENWQAVRILDPDTITSGEVGTTISFSGTGAGGQAWTSIACWFSVPPEAAQSGAYLSVSLELIDAAQQLQVLLRQQEVTQEQEELPDLGTITLGEATLTLLKPMETYGAGPTLEPTITGNHYIAGPLVVYKVRDVEGTTDLVGWNAVRAWYEATIVARPIAGDWFPISAPAASAAKKIINGVSTVQYTVTIQLGEVV